MLDRQHRHAHPVHEQVFRAFHQVRRLVPSSVPQPLLDVAHDFDLDAIHAQLVLLVRLGWNELLANDVALALSTQVNFALSATFT